MVNKKQDPAMREKWDTHYQEAPYEQAAKVLYDNQHLLPQQGTALDLACGMGSNALLLAEAGLDTSAWEISPIGVTRLNDESKKRGLRIHTEVRDCIAHPPEPDQFDVIVVTRFLKREIFPNLINALKPKGLMFYQTFTQTKTDECGPDDPIFRLADNELRQLIKPLRLIVYREEGNLGDCNKGYRNFAMCVAQKI